MYNNETSIKHSLCCIDDGMRYIDSDVYGSSVEVIVVNDGSSDNSCNTVQNILQNRNIHFVRLLEQPHKGAAAARNYGLSQAKGQFVWFVDADDFISVDALHYILPTLKNQAPNVDLFKMGAMRKIKRTNHFGTVPQPSETPASAITITPEATQIVGVDQLFGAQLGTLDHTTYISRRNFLIQENLCYPEGMSILEDSLFILQCLKSAHSVSYNSSFRFYNFCNRGQNSTTHNRWNREICALFIPNIILFFKEFRTAVENNFARGTNFKELYDRYLYVYLRVLTVKGCPWSFIASFRQEANIPNTFYYGVPDIKMSIFKNECIHFILSTMCRIIRPIYSYINTHINTLGVKC